MDKFVDSKGKTVLIIDDGGNLFNSEQEFRDKVLDKKKEELKKETDDAANESKVLSSD